MDLMTNSTTFNALKRKYENFKPATIKVEIDGTDIISKKKASVRDVEVELTSEYPSSGASFNVYNDYDHDSRNFKKKGSYQLLQLGAKVDIYLGYIRVEKVFSGYISEISYSFGEGNAPYTHIECVDVKCLLMKYQRLEVRAEKDVAKLVAALLGDDPVSSYISGKDIKFKQSQKELPLQMSMDSDYDYIVKLAQYCGCEFFVVAGKVYFREKPKSASRIMEISPNKGILSANLSLHGTSLVKKVKVVSIDPKTDKMISGEAVIKGKFASGASSGPKKMMGASMRTYYDPQSISEKEAGDRAKIIMNGIIEQFASIEVQTLGMPEIVPGRDIKISGLMKDANKTFYITRVSHTFDQDGYNTTFDGRLESL